MKNIIYWKTKLTVLILVTFFTVLMFVNNATAIPAFARKYKTSCITCHYAFPKLNAFGKAFRNNGYRYANGQDPEMTKDEPLSLGAESYKRVFPNAIWPSDIAGTTPLGVQAIGRIHFDKDLTSFQIPNEVGLYFGGTMGDKISYWAELEWENAEEFGKAIFINYDFSAGFHFKLGDIALNASPQHLNLTSEDYNVAVLTTQSGEMTLGEGVGAGMEIWGAVNGPGGKGGLTYALGVGNGQSDEENFDLNNKKDICGRITYKIGGLGEAGGTAGQSSNVSAYYIDNSFRIGGLFQTGTAISENMNDKYSILGGDIDWWYKRLNVVGMAINMKSDYDNYSRNSFAYFIEGNYVLYPWLIAKSRYEYTNVDTNDNNLDPTNNLITALVCMLRANVRGTFEYRLPLDEPSRNAEMGRFTIQFAYAF